MRARVLVMLSSVVLSLSSSCTRAPNAGVENGLGAAPPRTDAWSGKASHHVGRMWGQYRLLPDGRILAIGGFGYFPGDTVDSCEIYDPATNTWSDAAPLPAAVSNAYATVLRSGHVMVFGGGGVDGSNSKQTVFFDPNGRTGSLPGAWSVGPDLPLGIGNAHVRAEPFQLADGTVLVAGGWVNTQSPLASDNMTDRAFLYTPGDQDPAAGRWSETHCMHHKRATPNSNLLADGRVLYLAGFVPGNAQSYWAIVPGSRPGEMVVQPADSGDADGGTTYLAVSAPSSGILVQHVLSGANGALSVAVARTIITVRLATDGNGASRSTAAEVAAAVNGSAAAAALVHASFTGSGAGHAGSTVLTEQVVAASSGEIYDPALRTWTEIAPMPAIDSDRANPFGSAMSLPLPPYYAPAPDSDAINPNYAGGRWSPTTEVLANGELLLAGGIGFDLGPTVGFYTRKSALVYNPSANTWRRVDDMAREHFGVRAATYRNNGDQVIVFGASFFGSFNDPVPEVFAGGRWTDTAEIPFTISSLFDANVVNTGSAIYLMGAFGFDFTATTEVAAFTPGLLPAAAQAHQPSASGRSKQEMMAIARRYR